MLADISHQLTVQILHSGEDASRNHITLDAREPVFHLIQPRRVRWCVMQPHVSVLLQKFLHTCGFVAADVVANHMNFLLRPLAGDHTGEEGDELLAGMRGAVLPMTSPVAVLSAANRLSVPLRLYSKPWLSARPGDSGNIRSLRSRA